jgi:hypothetical protein
VFPPGLGNSAGNLRCRSFLVKRGHRCWAGGLVGNPKYNSGLHRSSCRCRCWHSEFGDNDEKLPDDIDNEKYIAIPDKRELDLGEPLVLDFAREFLTDGYDEVRHIFSRRGAYRRYKDLLVRRGALNGGTISRTSPRRQLCGSGARRTGSKSARPKVTPVRCTGSLTQAWDTPESVQLLAQSQKGGLDQHDENCGTKSSNPLPSSGESAANRAANPTGITLFRSGRN